jgi:hypothetical protein
MKRNGDTQSIMATDMGYSRITLNRKLNETRGASFTLPDLSFLKKRWQLTDARFITIFFADNVS